MNGTPLPDDLIGTDGDDALFGLDGNDTISGGLGFDTLFGGDGDDELLGGADENVFVGGRGDDLISGVFGDLSSDSGDTVDYNQEDGTLGVYVNLATGTATDTLGFTDTLIDIEVARGTSRADSLVGGDSFNDGFEGFMGLNGRDTIHGGSGFDETRYDRDAASGGGAGIVANLRVGRIRDGFGTLDVVSGIERIRGTALDDLVVGDAFDNVFIALAGNDTFNGGLGHDLIDYSRDAGNFDATGSVLGIAGVQIDLSARTATDGFGDTDTLHAVEDARATAFSDTVAGSGADNEITLRAGNDQGFGRNGSDVIFGGTGSDTLNGGAGDDVLFGDEDNDRLAGRTGSDNLFGDAGNDTLSGGDGIDFLTGGEGDDQLIGNAGADYFIFNELDAGSDKIVDFTSAEDVLLFDADLFLKLPNQQLTLGTDFFLSTTSSAGTGFLPVFIYETDSGRIWFDPDGSGTAASSLIARLTGAPVIEASDFQFAG